VVILRKVANMLEETFFDKWKEECGVFGVYAPKSNVANMAYFGLYALQHRGQESAGIAVADGSQIELVKGMGLVAEVFRKGLPELPGHIAMGHVRYSTTGSSMLVNTQPLQVSFAGGSMALAHNGNLVNAKELRIELEKRGSVFQTSIDSEVIVNLIARSEKESMEGRIVETMGRLKGAYSLVIMTQDKLIGARDPFGIRPMCIGKLGNGWVLASESCALDTIGAELVRDVKPGEVIVIDECGLTAIQALPGRKDAMCIFEFIYFARPDSIIEGLSVQQTRFEMGRQLARENKIDADIVISVPDSGTSAALGYAAQSGIPFNEGLLKNRYVGRTFIQPDQKMREAGVRVKLNAINQVVNGKRIIMVDDSIVRGTTSGQIVKLLKEAGAKEVHFCVSSPPITHPCYYGIDTSVRKELVAATKTVEEIRRMIGADSLNYLSLEGLMKSAGTIENKLCNACFCGSYPTEVPTELEDNKFIFEQSGGCGC
jgi:amidophosphoribosyltransferase